MEYWQGVENMAAILASRSRARAFPRVAKAA